jgi:hypothetical protein
MRQPRENEAVCKSMRRSPLTPASRFAWRITNHFVKSKGEVVLRSIADISAIDIAIPDHTTLSAVVV